ncbi:MAG TPA: hypothetical protein VHC43_16225 [Mycobacteriales bacterium]|nr:hypothetical protein [Mycobacteriales bacterium]
MRAVRERRDSGAVAVIVALVLAFAMIPALALGTGTYVRSSTATELQRAADTGSLAGAAEIPLGDLNFAENYLSAITVTSGVATTLQALGIQNDPSLRDPLTDAESVCEQDAGNTENLGHAYASTPTCTAVYLPDDGVLGAAQSCLNSLAGLNNLTSGLGSLLSLLGLGALSPDKLFAALESTLPGLLDPAIKVTATWHVKAPFDSVFGSDGSDQTAVSIARRKFKNAVVLPEIPIGTTTVNVNPTLQIARTDLLSTLTSVETVLHTLNALVPGIGSCASVIDDLSGDLADAVDPPSNGPSLQTLLDEGVESQQPVLAVSTTVVGLGIPFLDMVPVCLQEVNGQYIAHLTSFGSCVITHQGPFRAVLRNS